MSLLFIGKRFSMYPNISVSVTPSGLLERPFIALRRVPAPRLSFPKTDLSYLYFVPVCKVMPSSMVNQQALEMCSRCPFALR